MKTSLNKLLQVLDVSLVDDRKNIFKGDVLKPDWMRIFGGQVVAQSLVSAQRTLDCEMFAHSLYCNFLRPGNPKEPIYYEVECVRDSRSFATRRIVAKQSGKIILTQDVSFHVKERGLDHHMEMPDTPPPEDFPSEYDAFPEQLEGRIGGLLQGWINERPIEMRFADPDAYFKPENHASSNRIWFRFTEPVEGDVHLKRILLAYVSDYTILGNSLMPHGKRFFDNDMMAASINHSVWFHRPYDANDWLLYHADTPSASEGLGFSRGSIFDRDGKLVASVAQEGLIRLIEPKEE